MESPLEQFKTAIAADNVPSAVAALQHAEVREQINNCLFDFGRPPLLVGRSPQMVDVLLEAGADIGKVSEFWAPGFWLDEIPPKSASICWPRALC